MTVQLLQLAASRLNYLGQTQRLLAQNIANLDTPSYTPKATVPFQAILDGSGPLPLAQTSAADIIPADNADFNADFSGQSQRPAARALDGNAVSLDGQLAAVSNNELSQQFAVNLYQTYLGMFHTALGPTP